MKKTIVLVAVALTLLMAPVFAEVTVNGDVEFGVSNDFADPSAVDEEKGDSGFVTEVDDLDLDITATVGDYTTVKFALCFDATQIYEGDVADITEVGYIEELHVFLDVFGAFGIEEDNAPFDLTFITGYNDEIGAKAYEGPTKIKWDDYSYANDRDPDINWVGGFQADFGDVTLQASSHLDFVADSDTDLNASGTYPGAFIGAFGSIEAAQIHEFEVFYNKICKKKFAGEYSYLSSVGASAVSEKLALGDSMDLIANAFVTLDWDADVTSSNEVADGLGMYVGGSTALIVSKLGLGVSGFVANAQETEEGTETDTRLALGFDVNYDFNDIFALYAALSFEDMLSEADLTFANSAADTTDYEATAGYEIGCTLDAGKSDYAFGYRSGSIDVQANDIDGLGEGIFMTVKCDF
ncbi:MAG: hypothetical protein PQJ59_07725 [Spirochaetales bacterium]|nr:hypothetical protein [Spirochaetales bacterium]